MKKQIIEEEGYSLVEIVVAVVLMALILSVAIPTIYNETLKTTAKTGLKTDLAAVGVVLAYTYDVNPPTVEEFQQLKEEVLTDYYRDNVDQTITEYVESIRFFYDEGFYCVEGVKVHSGNTYVMNYNTVTNSVIELDCVDFFDSLD